MCGRFVVKDTTANELATLVGDLGPLRPDYNIAPTETVQVVRERKGARRLSEVRWGFVPSWYPDLKKQPQPINARLETVTTSGMFRKQFATARCIVPAGGYYEWVVTPTGKQPYFIEDPGHSIAMAGIVSAWPDRSKPEDDPGKWVLSLAIITRDAHVAPGEVHDRMPACLTGDAFDDWLGDHLGPGELLALLDRTSFEVAQELVHHPVSREVNRPGVKDARLIEPLPE